MTYEYVDKLSPEAHARYLEKLNCLGVDKCPFKEPADNWINNPKQWPPVEYNDVYHYLIKSPRLYSSVAMENYRSLDAHKFFTSGWVQTVYHYKTSRGDFMFKADVKPSWRVTDEPHHPWVAIKKDGPVIAAHCDCMAGLGETCSHIGAVLFKIEAAVRLGYTSACTDVPCEWNQCFVRKVAPSPVSQIKFYTETAKAKVRNSKRKKMEVYEAPTAEKVEKFLTGLKSLNENIVGLSGFKEYAEPFIGLGPASSTQNVPSSLRTLHRSEYADLDEEQLQSLCTKTFGEIKVTEEQCKYVEEVTVTQSASPTWHNVRLGRITASIVGDVLNTNTTNPAPSLIQKICVGQKVINTPALEWGREKEVDAVALYRLLIHKTCDTNAVPPSGKIYLGPDMKMEHENGRFKKAGFVIDRDRPYIGASPDGHVMCECCEDGLVEVKCPYKFKETSFLSAVADNGFYIDSHFQLKEKHKYYAQVQLQMYICKVQYVDFVVWSPVDCIITRVKRNNEFIDNMLVRCEEIWRLHILSELLTRKKECQKLNSSEANVQSNVEDGTFCICKSSEESGQMVACDRCDTWFHLDCLKLKRLPKTKTWYCKKCRLHKK